MENRKIIQHLKQDLGTSGKTGLRYIRDENGCKGALLPNRRREGSGAAGCRCGQRRVCTVQMASAVARQRHHGSGGYPYACALCPALLQKICGLSCVNYSHMPLYESHNLVHIFSYIYLLRLAEWLTLAPLSLSDTWRDKNCWVDWMPGQAYLRPPSQGLIHDVPKSCFL